MDKEDYDPPYETHHQRATELLQEHLLILPERKRHSLADKQKRCDQMWRLYSDEGWSLFEVGRAFGHLSKERIRQIFMEFGRQPRPMPGTPEYRAMKAVT